MPTLTVSLNTSITDANTISTFQKEVSTKLAKELGKPEKWMMIVVQPNIPIVFGGSDEPAAYCTLHSIGGIEASANGRYAKLISNLIQTHFGVNLERIYITFTDYSPANYAWNGNTFA